MKLITRYHGQPAGTNVKELIIVGIADSDSGVELIQREDAKKAKKKYDPSIYTVTDIPANTLAYRFTF